MHIIIYFTSNNEGSHFDDEDSTHKKVLTNNSLTCSRSTKLSIIRWPPPKLAACNFNACFAHKNAFLIIIIIIQAFSLKAYQH